MIKKAMGGVLFIDEAYFLYRPENERDYGKEAIEILLQAMEDHRDDFVVIFHTEWRITLTFPIMMMKNWSRLPIECLSRCNTSYLKGQKQRSASTFLLDVKDPTFLTLVRLEMRLIDAVSGKQNDYLMVERRALREMI